MFPSIATLWVFTVFLMIHIPYIAALLFAKRQNFRRVKIGSICCRQYKCDRKIEILFGKGKKTFSEGFLEFVTSWD